MERVKSVTITTTRHRLRIYSPRFVRYAKPKVHTHEGVVQLDSWFKLFKPRRAR